MEATFIPEIWERVMLDSVEKDLVISKTIIKSEVINSIKEYQTLNNRHWKRKRVLEKYIAQNIGYWLPILEDTESKESVIKIPKIGHLFPSNLEH